MTDHERRLRPLVEKFIRNKGLTQVEKRMCDFIGIGRENAVTSQELQDLFDYDDHHFKDGDIGDIIRDLTNKHRIPIVGSTVGFYWPAIDEESERCMASMGSRRKEIRKRMDNYRIGQKAWFLMQQEETQMNLFVRPLEYVGAG